MANKKDKNRNHYRPIKNPELLGGEKETLKEILDRGSRGKPVDKNWTPPEKDRNDDKKMEVIKKQMAKRNELTKQTSKTEKEHEREKD